MNKEKLFQDYMTALETCVELSRRRAFGAIEGTLTKDEDCALKAEYSKALFDCARKRNEWMQLRGAELLGLDE